MARPLNPGDSVFLAEPHAIKAPSGRSMPVDSAYDAGSPATVLEVDDGQGNAYVEFWQKQGRDDGRWYVDWRLLRPLHNHVPDLADPTAVTAWLET